MRRPPRSPDSSIPPSGRRAAGWLFALLAGALSCAASARAADTRIFSAAAGPGGKLAVRVTPPAAPRYATRAPVAVIAPGGHGPGSLGASLPLGAHGFLVVTFLFPGGSDSLFRSDGVFDYRGPGCQLALRDALRFASGALPDTAGRTLSEIAGVAALADDVGIVALSNGGSIAPIAVARFAADLPGVCWMAGWENPTGPQTINADLGVTRYDCDAAFDGDGNGVPADDGKNWAYAAYDTQDCVLDYARLAWDAAYPVRYADPALVHSPATLNGALFFDGNANGRYDIVPGSQPPCPDLDGNGRLDADEDYLLSDLPAYGPVTEGDSLKVFFSPGAVAAAEARGLFGASWPAHVATPGQASAYWNARDATRHYALLAAGRPDFAALLLYRKGDHVQAEDDHAHVRQAYDGFAGHGLWCRLNPDLAYYAALAVPPVGYVETPANAAVAGAEMKAHAEPNSVNLSLFEVAGACELADRVYFGVWDADLDAILGPVTGIEPPPAPPAPGGGAALRLDVLERVFRGGDLRLRLSGGAPGSLFRVALVDVAGREVCATTVEAPATPREWRWRVGGPGGRPRAGVYWVRASDGRGAVAGDRVVLLP